MIRLNISLKTSNQLNHGSDFNQLGLDGRIGFMEITARNSLARKEVDPAWGRYSSDKKNHK